MMRQIWGIEKRKFGGTREDGYGSLMHWCGRQWSTEQKYEDEKKEECRKRAEEIHKMGYWGWGGIRRGICDKDRGAERELLRERAGQRAIGFEERLEREEEGGIAKKC